MAWSLQVFRLLPAARFAIGLSGWLFVRPFCKIGKLSSSSPDLLLTLSSLYTDSHSLSGLLLYSHTDPTSTTSESLLQPFTSLKANEPPMNIAVTLSLTITSRSFLVMSWTSLSFHEPLALPYFQRKMPSCLPLENLSRSIREASLFYVLIIWYHP